MEFIKNEYLSSKGETCQVDRYLVSNEGVVYDVWERKYVTSKFCKETNDLMVELHLHLDNEIYPTHQVTVSCAKLVQDLKLNLGYIQRVDENGELTGERYKYTKPAKNKVLAKL